MSLTPQEPRTLTLSSAVPSIAKSQFLNFGVERIIAPKPAHMTVVAPSNSAQRQRTSNRAGARLKSCEECRQTKKKCDRSAGCCSRCNRLGKSCVYMSRKSRLSSHSSCNQPVVSVNVGLALVAPSIPSSASRATKLHAVMQQSVDIHYWKESVNLGTVSPPIPPPQAPLSPPYSTVSFTAPQSPPNAKARISFLVD
ncbi:hypothetical protein BC830DRAFT_1113305 [Chytriomyces sp. MP71]|nr:hypothetical protein BC830DRAFT_1113305 [Chytriomyces sp. MP71]